MRVGSLITNQPRRQPGTNHRLDKEPIVKTGTIDPKTPIATKGLSPKVRCP